jgi:hypothetical protein
VALIEVPIEGITDWSSFHTVFASVLHFLDYCGRSGNAFVDCLRDIACYDANSMLRLGDGVTLTLYLGDHIAEFQRRCPEQLEALLSWTAFVNADAVDDERSQSFAVAYR